MIELKLTDQDIQNIITSLISTAKMPTIDRNGMVALLMLVQNIESQMNNQNKIEQESKQRSRHKKPGINESENMPM